MRKDYIFTSESVSEGHPDKICDQISDVILDELLRSSDADSKFQVRCACEALVKDNYVLCAGEIFPKIKDEKVTQLIRRLIRSIGYVDPAMGFSADECEIDFRLGEQSSDICRGVDREELKKQGAGDQGLMFGYACDDKLEENEKHYMPAPIYYAHRLVQAQAQARKSGEVDFFGPDAKSQITFEYENDKPARINTIVFSTQHSEEASDSQIEEAVRETIIKNAIPRQWRDQLNKDCIHINPTGRFVTGGPKGDCGLTGRKIIVDTYGGMARHGGGAFSGKDPSKVDRSAAYAARYAAKNVVASGLAEKCEIQLAYAIGKHEPVSVMAETFGTGKITDAELEKRVKASFNFTPYSIIHEMLDLIRPIYQQTASYGHFGRSVFPWEQCDKMDALVNS